jgi:2-polyprenyl-6-methoxyphenol hydroxylase-like FAD-dependent oxidoreductase
MAEQYDLILVGGGIAGSSLAGTVAKAGARVLVLERERTFKDRVRGEWLAPWGVAEAEQLGTLEVLREHAHAHDLRFHHTGIHALAGAAEDLIESSKVHRAALTFFHPDAQEALLTWAAEQGAEVIRSARVTALTAGETPAVEWGGGATREEGSRQDGRGGTASARLVVGADGRTSLVRKAFGRPEQSRGATRLWAGVRLKNLDWPSDTGMVLFDPPSGLTGAAFPQIDGSARVYLGFTGEERKRLSGERDLGAFLEGMNTLLGDRDVFGAVEAVGPLATFDVEMRWVETPYEDGLALIGDAAGYTDPTWGQGLALGFRDARVLGGLLSEQSDWQAAASSYAAEHDGYFANMVAAESWVDKLLFTAGPEGDAVRARVLPAWGQDHTRNPDAFFNGPEFDASEEGRQRYFALDLV